MIYEDIGCEQPKLTLSANVMSGEMICRTNSADDAETAGKDFSLDRHERLGPL